MRTPDADEVDEVVDVLSSWQHDGAPIQLHPGDLGWQWRFGTEALVRDLRLWRRDGAIAAIGFVDSYGLIRMAVAPTADDDEALADQILADLSDPSRGVLPADKATVEARFGAALRQLLRDRGWADDEPWTPLRRDLTEPVPTDGLRVEVVGPGHVDDRVAVQRAAFDTSTFTVERWHTMAAEPPYRRARCLVGYDEQGAAVAATTVWSAGAGRPGLIEPMGVHRDHRGRGHGTAITVAGAAALRDLGSSSALVATPAANRAGVATYVAAGFHASPEVTDLRRRG